MDIPETLQDWPILGVSRAWDGVEPESRWFSDLVASLETARHCALLPVSSYDDAREVVARRTDLGCVLIDWDLPGDAASGAAEDSERATALELVKAIRARNGSLPLFLITGRKSVCDLSPELVASIDSCLWRGEDKPDFLAGRIANAIERYVQSLLPPFFGELLNYAERYKYAWHTPGHLGGEGFLKDPAGMAFYKYVGENILRSDLSISAPELGSLLDHSGVVGDAERNSARVFGADQSYYVLNGTSTVNQIIWRSQLVRDEIALVDRNCHKSLNYAMVITEANPVYMVPRRNHLGIIGPVRLSEFESAALKKQLDASPLIQSSEASPRAKMCALTNSTYDGICYNTTKIKRALRDTTENIHFDEAWFAYAKFHPIYHDHFGMGAAPIEPDDKPIFCSQSTHKLLTAFSQCSMLHIRNGEKRAIDPVQFNESYMMHASTSPFYPMIASLDVATKMMADDGEALLGETIAQACRFRQQVARLHRDYEAKGDWFFNLWQPYRVEYEGAMVDFEDVPLDYLATRQEPWVLSEANPWHGFAAMEDDYCMLDPIKLTFRCPGVHDDRTIDDFGVPASVVTNYLINAGIVCEKSDYFSFLMLNSLGTTESKQAALLAALMRFKADYDRNRPLADVFPELVARYPEVYANRGLRDHCVAMHGFIQRNAMLKAMDRAFEVIPDQVMNPADAYHRVVRGDVELCFLDEMGGRIPAVMMVPYPPGIPIIMGGEILNEKAQPILDYLKLRERFEQEFPGYTSDIHGVERTTRDGKTCFQTLCIKK